MGCLFSNVKFVVNNNVVGQDQVALEVFQLLGFTDKEINTFFRTFQEIDGNGSGTIQPLELFTYFSMELGQFEKSLFSVFDDDKSGKLNFMEFVCSMWNLLTLPESQLGALAYLMKDPSGVLRISHSEVKAIVESMHHKKVESSSTLTGFFQELRNNYGTEISIQEFCKWTTLNPSIITPLLMLQLKFRKSILGDSVWQKKAKERAEDKEMNTVEYIRKLHNLIKSKIKEQVKKIELNKKEKSFKSSKSASEKNIARKHSVLLEAFNLKPQQSKKSSKLTPLSVDADEDLSSPIKSPSRRKLDSPSPLSQKNTSKSFDEEISPSPLSRKKSRKNNSIKFEANDNDNDNPPKLSRKESKNKLDSTSRKGSSKYAATSNTEGESKKEKRPKSAKRK